MKKVSILVPELAAVEALSDAHIFFSKANVILEKAGGPPLFDVKLVGLRENMTPSLRMFSVRCDEVFHQVQHTDLLIIPALSGDPLEALRLNQDLLHWIKERYYRGTEVVSLCTGAFLLASTGLLAGKKCATDWNSTNQFRKMFPDVLLQEDVIFTEQDRLYTGSGMNSYLNLLVRLIEINAGRAVAVEVAKSFHVDIDRKSQLAYATFNGQKDHDDDQIRNAQEFIEGNFSDRISVDSLADRFAIGRRSFERRFKRATYNTVVEYMQKVKVEAAKKSLENTNKEVTHIMSEVGYTDTKAFRDIFKRITGLTPLEYRSKYNATVALQD